MSHYSFKPDMNYNKKGQMTSVKQQADTKKPFMSSPNEINSRTQYSAIQLSIKCPLSKSFSCQFPLLSCLVHPFLVNITCKMRNIPRNEKNALSMSMLHFHCVRFSKREEGKEITKTSFWGEGGGA